MPKNETAPTFQVLAHIFTERRDALSHWVEQGMKPGTLWPPVSVGDTELWVVADTKARFRNGVRDKLIDLEVNPLTVNEAHRLIRDEWKNSEQPTEEEDK